MNDVIDCSASDFVAHDLKCDILVIGSGCGGGTAARVLAEGGKDVILLEEGGDFVGPERLTQRDAAMYDQLYVDRGGRGWNARVNSLGDGSRWGSVDRLLLRNLKDTSTLQS